MQIGTFFSFSWAIFFVEIYIYMKGEKCTLMHSYVTFNKNAKAQLAFPIINFLNVTCLWYVFYMTSILVNMFDVTTCIYAINLYLRECIICKLYFQPMLFLIAKFSLNWWDFSDKQCHMICKWVLSNLLNLFIYIL